jgi:hypothetical protein
MNHFLSRGAVSLLAVAFLAFGPVHAVAAGIDTNVVSYWKFDETSGSSAADATGGGSVGTLQASTAFNVGGKINYGILSNAASSVGVNLGTIASLDLSSYPLSVAGWFKTSRASSVPNSEMIIFTSTKTSSPYSQYTLSMVMDGTANAGKVIARYRDSSGNDYAAMSGTAFNDNSYHYAVLTISGSGAMKLYVDNAVAATTAASGSLFTGTKKSVIGINWDVSTNGPWYGYLDEIAVWNRELSAAEVSSLYNAGRGLQYPFILATFAPWLFSEL